MSRSDFDISGFVKGASRQWRVMLAGFLLFGALPAASAAESVYTKLDLDSCEVLKRYEASGGVDLKCAGYNDVPVYVSDGDARMDVDCGVANDTFETFGPFSTIGETVEWRAANNREPFAAVIRYYLDKGITGGPDDKSQVLVVLTVGSEGTPGSVTAVVDARHSIRRMARRAARPPSPQDINAVQTLPS